jgi:hypothetical protein
MVIAESSKISDSVHSKLVDAGISIVRIKPDGEGDYINRANKQVIKLAVEDRLQPK